METLLSVHALAEYLDVPVSTVYRWNHQGTGPHFMRVGKHVRYRPEDVESWLNEHAAPAGDAA